MKERKKKILSPRFEFTYSIYLFEPSPAFPRFHPHGRSMEI